VSGSPAKPGVAVEQVVVYGLLTALGLGALVMALSYGLFLDDLRVGPGLVPAVVGALILLIGGWELLATLRGHRTSHDHGLAEIVVAAVDTPAAPVDPEGTAAPDDGPVELHGPSRANGAVAGPGAGPGVDDIDIFGRTPQQRARQLLIVFVALVVAVLLVPVLGFLVSFFVLSLFISAVVERRRWIPSVIVSFLAVAAVYGLFVGFLEVPLPTGLLGIGG
jgi:hypothetical protein